MQSAFEQRLLGACFLLRRGRKQLRAAFSANTCVNRTLSDDAFIHLPAVQLIHNAQEGGSTAAYIHALFVYFLYSFCALVAASATDTRASKQQSSLVSPYYFAFCRPASFSHPPGCLLPACLPVYPLAAFALFHL
jgi:hypothetical protein